MIFTTLFVNKGAILDSRLRGNDGEAVNAGGFESDRGDAALAEPVDQVAESGCVSGELADVTAAFPKVDRPTALAALRRYKLRREAARVRLAILVLADGDLAEVRRLVAAANQDYRDLLYWAEYPEESGAGTKTQMAPDAEPFSWPADLNKTEDPSAN